MPTTSTAHAGSGPQRLRLLAAAALPPVAAPLVLLSYHHAAGLTKPDQAQFALYWAGFLGGMLPLVALACTPRIDDVMRAFALVGIGVFGMVPKLLRTPPGPLDSDEFSHLRQSIETYFNGDVGHVSHLLPITKEFPGLHQAVSAFASLTGLPLWHAGLAVIVIAHVLSVLAIYQLIRAIGMSAHGAAGGAVVYTVNPSWVYFDTAVSYESLALPMLLWCLATTITASSGAKRPDLRTIAAIVLCTATLPTIHHLTTIMLGPIMAILIAACVTRRVRSPGARYNSAPRERMWPLLFTASCLAVSIAFWWSGKYGWLVTYLSPALTSGWTQLSEVLGVAEKPPADSSGERALFSGAQNPRYEIVSGLMFPVVVLVLFLVSFAVLWRNRRRVGSTPWAFATLGAMYFVSMPMVLTRGGAEGAHRSWAFSFIGIAVLCGLAWSFAVPSDARHRPHSAATTFSRFVARISSSGVRVGAVAVVVCVMSFGDAATGVNVSTRFPGSAHVGDDARSVSREGGAVTAWIAAQTPVDTPVLADRYVSQQLGSRGRMASLRPSATFPMWDLYISADPIRADVLKQVLDAKIRYFVVDARMAATRPLMGYFFTKDEPGVHGTRLYPQAAIDRFNCLPWLRARFGAGPLTVYEVDTDVLRRTMAGSCERRSS